jgi:hypothetical protein
MKILAEEKLRGFTFNLPDIGKTTIPENGILDVEESLGKALIDSNIGYSDPSVKIESDVEPKEQSNSKSDLESLSLEDLILMCKEANLPESEWLKLSQNSKKAHALMVNYLSKKI